MNSLVLEYQIFVRLIIDIPILRCGYPCSHVLKITNELMLDMIKVQHWKLYSSHYNDDDTGIVFELKKIKWNTNIMMEWEYLLPGKY